MSYAAKHDLPESPFNRNSTAEEVLEGQDLSGKTILVTGVNAGLGKETVRVLSEHGAHVIGLARSLESAQKICSQLANPATAYACELTNPESIIQCAEAIVDSGVALDAVILNAGIMSLPTVEQVDGIEKQFYTNHLGHFLLTNRLMPAIRKAESGRIVVLSSSAHNLPPKGGIQFDNLSGEKGYNPTRNYGQSKLANLLFAKQLAKKLEGTRITANAVHPGMITTELGRYLDAGWVFRLITVLVMPWHRSIPQGAATQVYVATSPRIEGVSGQYFVDSNPAKHSKYAQDADLAEKLWGETEKLLSAHLKDW